MKKRIIVTIMLMVFGTPLLALSAEQEQVINESYNIGKQVKAKDGMTFEWALAAVGMTESSSGRNIIGDEHYSRKLKKASLGVYQVRFDTAIYIIKRDKLMNKYYSFLLLKRNENRLVTLLLTNSKFSGMLAATYLKMNYEAALKKGSPKPYFHAISRYNGGCWNYAYYERVMKNMRMIKRLKIVKFNSDKVALI